MESFLHMLTMFSSSMPAKRPNTRPAKKASKRGHPTAQLNSHTQETPAEMATALVDDDCFQSAINATIEGILPRRSGCTIAHRLGWTGPQPWRLRHGSQTRLSLAHWQGGGYPQPRLLTTQWSGTRARGITLGMAMGSPGTSWDAHGPPIPEEPVLVPGRAIQLPCLYARGRQDVHCNLPQLI